MQALSVRKLAAENNARYNVSAADIDNLEGDKPVVCKHAVALCNKLS